LKQGMQSSDRKSQRIVVAGCIEAIVGTREQGTKLGLPRVLEYLFKL